MNKFKVGDIVLVNRRTPKDYLKKWLEDSPLGTGIVRRINTYTGVMYPIIVVPLPYKEDAETYAFQIRELKQVHRDEES